MCLYVDEHRLLSVDEQVQQVKLFNKRVMYGSDVGFVGLANTVDGTDIFRQQVCVLVPHHSRSLAVTSARGAYT